MALEEAEYQVLFNAKGAAEKNYKIRERTSNFFGKPRSCWHWCWRCPRPLAPANATPKNHLQARQAGQGGYRR